MPVHGLPSTLERMLNAALSEMTLSSFKIDGRGENTVVVLRLTATSTTGVHSMAQGDQCAVYRKKGPAQVNRDKRRAEAHRQIKTADEREMSPSGLFLPTPPSLVDHKDETHLVDTCVYNPPPSASVPEKDTRQSSVHIDMVMPSDTQTLAMPEFHDFHDEAVQAEVCEELGDAGGDGDSDVVMDMNGEDAKQMERADSPCNKDDNSGGDDGGEQRAEKFEKTDLLDRLARWEKILTDKGCKLASSKQSTDTG